MNENPGNCLYSNFHLLGIFVIGTENCYLNNLFTMYHQLVSKVHSYRLRVLTRYTFVSYTSEMTDSILYILFMVN